ncbi:MAG: protein-export chaperone SecB [Litorimonas sp.]
MAKTPKKTDEKTEDKTVDENSLNIAPEDAPTPAPTQSDEPQGGQAATGEPVGAGGDQPQAGQPMLSVLAQYTRDVSFENPNAPGSLRSNQTPPEVNIDLRIGRQVNQDNTVEVSLLIKAHATREGQTIFLAEIDYAGLFAVQNMSLEQIQPMMMIECPRILFPYARKILGDLTQDGGHLPIMLDMPDFAGMFREEMMRRAQEQGLN